MAEPGVRRPAWRTVGGRRWRTGAPVRRAAAPFPPLRAPPRPAARLTRLGSPLGSGAGWRVTVTRKIGARDAVADEAAQLLVQVGTPRAGTR